MVYLREYASLKKDMRPNSMNIERYNELYDNSKTEKM